MKYMNFKRHKFVTIEKKINTIRYRLSKFFKFRGFGRYDLGIFFKYIDIRRLKFKFQDFRRNNLILFFKYIDIRRLKFKFQDFRRNDLILFFKYINIRSLKYKNVRKYFIFTRYNIKELTKINFTRNKVLFLHLPLAVIFFGFLYIVIPIFYNYDKFEIEKICKKNNIECQINGKVSYRFYPTPRIHIKDLTVKDIKEKKKKVITIDNVTIKLSIKNLLAKDKHQFKKIVGSKYEVNLNLKNFKEYKNIFKNNNEHAPIILKKGKIIFFEDDNYVGIINNAKINLNSIKNTTKSTIKGNFLNESINIDYKNEIKNNEEITNLVLKMPSSKLLTKVNFSKTNTNKNIINGNILIKRDKNKLTAIFNHQDNKFNIIKSNLRNPFVDGKLEGTITFFPYFGFDLDVNLNSLNFTKLHNYFVSLDKNEKKKFFKINKKINGKLSLSSDRVYSNYNLVKSFESRLKFNNGDIIIDQFLINLGKLGAADLLGSINNDKDLTNLKFTSNIFVDNKKKFLSKFAIYNEENISPNLFISGNFDLQNLRSSFYEIEGKEKLSNEDVNFIEDEFNNYMLEDGYKSLFKFPEFKKFIKSISSN